VGEAVALHFEDISDVAALHGWTIPVKVVKETYDAVIKPKRRELLSDRLYIVLRAVTSAAKQHKNRFVVPFAVPVTPFRDGCKLWAGLRNGCNGPEVIIVTEKDAAKLAKLLEKP
jgi:hypothetical protein